LMSLIAMLGLVWLLQDGSKCRDVLHPDFAVG